jgi:hypothetical protein
MKIFEIETTEEMPKCGGCNWETGSLYALASSAEEAQELYDDDQAGCCAQCIVDLLCYYEIVGAPENPCCSCRFQHYDHAHKPYCTRAHWSDEPRNACEGVRECTFHEEA